MMLALVNEAAPVPPPAYHRAQTRLGPALHIDALTLVNTLHLLTLCRLAVSLAHRRCPPPLPAGPGERLAHTAMSRCYSSRSYARSGGFPIEICATGYVIGLLWPWPAACRWARRPSAHSLCLPTMQAWKSCWGTAARSVICPHRSDRSAPSAHERP
ncbi:MAG: hypothetical protein ACJ8BW_08910 [Ktedonobacteraceae bacterium]